MKIPNRKSQTIAGQWSACWGDSSDFKGQVNNQGESKRVARPRSGLLPTQFKFRVTTAKKNLTRLGRCRRDPVDHQGRRWL